MKIRYFLRHLLSCVMIYFMSSAVNAGTPVWTFTPLTATTITVPINSTANVQYQVTNQSSTSHTLVMQPIKGVSQITTGSGVCGSTFSLAYKASCVLSLQINGSQVTTPISDGPIVCQQGSSAQCYRPGSADILRVTVQPVPVATISVSGSPLGLVQNGASGILTITNTSSNMTAALITADFTGTPLDGNVSIVANTCGSVLPGAMCTITFLPGGTLVSQTNFPIQGTNTNTVIAAISVVPPAPEVTNISPNSGTTAGGTIVTLTGVELSATTSVTFDGVRATLDEIHPTTVKVKTPAHSAGAVDVKLATPGGAATLFGAYTYIVVPPNSPHIDSFSPTSGSTAGNEAVEIYGINFTNPTQVDFGSDPASSVVFHDSTHLTVLTPSHAPGFYTITVTTSHGTDTSQLQFQFI